MYPILGWCIFTTPTHFTVVCFLTPHHYLTHRHKHNGEKEKKYVIKKIGLTKIVWLNLHFLPTLASNIMIYLY